MALLKHRAGPSLVEELLGRGLALDGGADLVVGAVAVSAGAEVAVLLGGRKKDKILSPEKRGAQHCVHKGGE
jgi:hypothetical protein